MNVLANLKILSSSTQDFERICDECHEPKKSASSESDSKVIILTVVLAVAAFAAGTIFARRK
jgi:hypothetical protein